MDLSRYGVRFGTQGQTLPFEFIPKMLKGTTALGIGLHSYF
jgi:hypothetical protein